MSNVNIRQLKDPVSGDVFYPQTDIAGLVSGGGPGIDAVPTAGSVKPVQSGGVFNDVTEAGVTNLSEVNKSGSTLATYASLSAALDAVPASYQRGGISIKFIDSNSNKYVQYRLTTATWSSVADNWQRYDSIKAEDVAFKQPSFNLQKGIYIPHNTPSYWDVVNYEVGILDNTGAISRAQSAYLNYKTFTFDISDYIGKELTLIITSGASNYASAWPAFITVDESDVKTIHHASGQPTVQYGYTTVNYTPVVGDKYLKASAGAGGLVYLMCGLDFNSGFNKPIMIFPATKTLINTKSDEINYPVLNYFNSEAEGIEYGGYYRNIDSEGNPIWYSSGNYAESDYIPIESTDIYKTTFDVQGNITSTNWGQVATMMYNADKEAVRFIANPGGHLVAREGEAYFRFAFNYRNGNKYDISINSNVDAYHPYQADDLTIKQYIAQIEAHIQTLYDSVNLRIDDLNSRLSEITGDGSQWIGKTWYAYGTSITSVSQGRYVPYLAALSQMNVVNKGIAGGGIGNLGAYSTGQVRAAIMNITDGKLDADLITLEVGANDTGEDVPLGTIYDNDDTTLCGCLNMCIRYLQENTNAQIVIMPSPATTTEPNAANKYYEAQWLFKQVCFVNKCWWIDGMTNLGQAKIIRTDVRYVRDNIHQTDLGGYVFARSIWAELKRIPLFYTAIPE